MRNYFDVCFSNTQVKTLILQPLFLKRCSPANSSVTSHNIIKHEKQFFEIAPCDSELNGRLTTSSLNGVQKLASTALSPIRWKIWSAIFIWLFLLLDAEQLFHNLSTKRCSPANSSVTSHNIQQTWEAVFWNCSLWLGAKRQAHNLWLTVFQK